MRCGVAETCKRCGLPEDRKTDKAGRQLVNLDPTTGLCVSCLVKAAMAKGRTLPARVQSEDESLGIGSATEKSNP